jgi:PAS domain-containing protein
MYSSSPIKKDGIISGIIVVFSGYNRNKKAQLALKESEEKSRLFIEAAPAAMAMFDKEMRYISVSRQWMKEYDLVDNVIGQKHYDLFPNILQRWKDVHSRCMAAMLKNQMMTTMKKDDGSRYG